MDFARLEQVAIQKPPRQIRGDRIRALPEQRKPVVAGGFIHQEMILDADVASLQESVENWNLFQNRTVLIPQLL